MTDPERIAALEAELATLQAYVRELLAENAALKRRLAQDSHNSSKPPASDGLARRPRPTRRPSGKKPGGQLGHPGHTLALVETPDAVETHVPVACGQCHRPLAGMSETVVERRQVQDLPPVRLEVTEHQAVAVRCPACQAVTRGAFPDGVAAPAQYGPRVRALAVYLHPEQLVPQERTHEALADLFGCPLSDGTVARWVAQAAEALAPTVAHLAELVAAGPHQHADETGIRVGGRLHWLHVNSTRLLTHLAWHPQRGQAATTAIGIWPRFHGRATHDRWASYHAYTGCTHSWCGAHRARANSPWWPSRMARRGPGRWRSCCAGCTPRPPNGAPAGPAACPTRSAAPGSPSTMRCWPVALPPMRPPPRPRWEPRLAPTLGVAARSKLPPRIC